MEHNNHTSNPTLSVVMGVVVGLGSYVTSHPVFFDNILQLVKVILFGTVGGFVGFFGKLFAESIWKKFNKK